MIPERAGFVFDVRLVKAIFGRVARCYEAPLACLASSRFPTNLAITTANLEPDRSRCNRSDRALDLRVDEPNDTLTPLSSE